MAIVLGKRASGLVRNAFPYTTEWQSPGGKTVKYFGISASRITLLIHSAKVRYNKGCSIPLVANSE
jgi:hypothetical protein